MDTKQFELIKEARQQKYTEICRKRLSDIAEKKIKTTFIGAIAAFEKEFGELWGIDLKDEDRDDDQKYWYEKWQLARTEILNNGNNQSRALLNEIANHVISWNRYTTTFKVIN